MGLTCRRPELENIRAVPSFLIRLSTGICAALAPMILSAAEPAAKGAAAPAVPPAAEKKAAPADAKAAPATDPDVYTLPKIEVTASRVKELDKEIKKLDKAIAREKKKLKTTELDKVLNNEKLTNAAAVFGGNSASYMIQVAATRVQYMETERSLLSDMREPRTLDEMKLLQAELERIRTMQRDLDKTSHY